METRSATAFGAEAGKVDEIADLFILFFSRGSDERMSDFDVLLAGSFAFLLDTTGDNVNCLFIFLGFAVAVFFVVELVIRGGSCFFFA